MMLAIFLFSSIPSETMPRFGEFDLSVKKGGHMLGYALLGITYWRALGRQRPKTMLLAWLLTLGYALTDEFHQSFVPGRSSRLLDIGIDGTGALIGLLATRWFTQSALRRQTNKSDTPPA
jgi:VanZ family protein